MAFITWKEEYSVGIDEVDRQHKKLFSLVSQLFEAMRVGKGKDVLGKVLKDLVDYTVYHFQTEERLFKEHDYPAYGEHKKEHDDLTQKASALKQDFDSGKAAISIEVMHFLKDWLNVHILQEDRKFGAFLNRKAA